MRVFVSSSFEDLREHRAAAIRVLRQLGHDVLAMEDMTAGSIAPLPKVLDMVDRSEAYLGIFAWRYGYVPAAPAPNQAALPQVTGAVPGQTSITHYEYLRAVQRKLPILAFLLDESSPWPPRLIDGFDAAGAYGRTSVEEIRKLRFALQQERVVSWFTTPADLEARVSAAITMAGLTRQLDLQPATALNPAAGTANDSSAERGIVEAIRAAGDQRRALKIDLRSTWWSTRLYLIAALAERLTNVRRILIVKSGSPAAVATGPVFGRDVVMSSGIAVPPPPVAQSGMAMAGDHEEFVGQISTSSILATLHSRIPVLGRFEASLRARPASYSVLETEISELIQEWQKTFGEGPPTPGSPPAQPPVREVTAKVDLSPDLLRRWFADAMLREPVRISDLQRASVVDLLRLLDYPSDFVPVVTRWQLDGTNTSERVDVLDKAALNARLARSYLVELMDRARIS